MKTKVTFLMCFSGFVLSAQTITYSNFSSSLTDTLTANIANNGSFNTALLTTTGNGVSWDASGLTVQAGTPTLHLSYGSPASTPNGSLFPSSNECSYDPALTAVVGYEYYNIGPDSITMWGTYEPGGAHEIFQDPDKRLVFPFIFGQSFTDNYSKTNYSSATTISSFQTGTRTVNFAGFGTLTLPQGTISNVAMIAESRTNSLGPVSTEYTWYNINTGKKLLMRSENDGTILTAWCAEELTGIRSIETAASVHVYPNPISDEGTISVESTYPVKQGKVKLYDVLGEFKGEYNLQNNQCIIRKSNLPDGVYFYSIESNGNNIVTGKIIFN